MGVGRAWVPQNFPQLFGPYHRTELLAALFRYGPMRAPLLERVFTFETPRSVKHRRSNLANLLVNAWASKGHKGGSGVVGVNPNLPVLPEVRRLIEAMAASHEVREITNDVLPVELEAFHAAEHPRVDIEALFGTYVRTRLLVALHVLDGEESIGKLQRSVLEIYYARVKVAIQGYLEEGILAREGTTIRFNDDLTWMPELRSLLEALARRMPKVAGYARHIRKTREEGEAGQCFHVFGSRVNQALLAALALYGPSNLMKLCAAAGASDIKGIEALVESGLVVRIPSRKGTTRDIFSLNAAHWTYREVRALLRTPTVLDDSLPFRSQRDPADVPDLSDPDPSRQYLPYALFGVATRERQAVANILGMLVHTPNEEAEPSSVRRLIGGKNDATTPFKTMRRLEKRGILTSRRYASTLLYRLDESWPAYRELRDLVLAMGREWIEYAEGANVESRLFLPSRRAMERGRRSAATR